jgi:phage shock protein A
MRLMLRAWNVIHGLANKLVYVFERKNPGALLELEKENLRKLVGRFNEGLVSHATLSERLKMQVSRGEAKTVDTTDRMQALVKAGEMKSAARYALELKEVSARLAEDRTQLAAAEQTYQQLVQTRDAAIDETRTKIEKLRWQIGDLKVNRAMADLQNMAATMVGNLGTPGDSLNRLEEMVGEEHEKAMARSRVATSNLSATDFAAREVEQDALAAQALAEFLENGPTPDGEPLALPHYGGSPIELLSPQRRKDRSFQKGKKS